MKKIGIYTKNFSLYHDILEILKKRKISYKSLSSKKDIPNQIGVIITSHNEIHGLNYSKIITADTNDNLDQVIDNAIQLLIGKDFYSKVIIGIDPGEKPGIALIADDILLKKTNIISPKTILKNIKKYLREYPSLDTLIRIGNGSTIYRNRIINDLINLNIPIEIVDEKKTTIDQNKGRCNKDSEAAAAIALIKGNIVNRIQPIKISKGDIRRIQEESRKLTKGKISISEKKAILVLNGKIDLEDAINSDIKNKKPKHL